MQCGTTHFLAAVGRAALLQVQVHPMYTLYIHIVYRRVQANSAMENGLYMYIQTIITKIRRTITYNVPVPVLSMLVSMGSGASAEVGVPPSPSPPPPPPPPPPVLAGSDRAFG